MKQSFFNRSVKLENGDWAVYNTLTGALYVFDSDEYSHFFLEDIHSLSPQECEAMQEKTLFVADDTDELSLVTEKRRQQIQGGDIPVYRLLVTTLCNARCPYCFEQGIQYETMDERTADAVIEFILKEAKNKEKIRVQWFGGEPLIKLDIIEYITNKLNRRFSGEIIYSIITNGSLLTREITKKLLNLGVKKAQISLDGDNEVYKKQKRYCDKNITLDYVLDNISAALEEGLPIVVRLNYDKTTISSIKRLIDTLRLRYHSFSNFSCYPYPLYGTYDTADACGTTGDDLLNLHKNLLDAGLIGINTLFRSVLGVKTAPCMAYKNNSFFISPLGKLFKCSIDMENDVGDVFEGVKENRFFNEWCNTSLNQECLSCNLLPICQGGCRAGALNKLPITCMRDKDIVDEIIKLKVLSCD